DLTFVGSFFEGSSMFVVPALAGPGLINCFGPAKAGTTNIGQTFPPRDSPIWGVCPNGTLLRGVDTPCTVGERWRTPIPGQQPKALFYEFTQVICDAAGSGVNSGPLRVGAGFV